MRRSRESARRTVTAENHTALRLNRCCAIECGVWCCWAAELEGRLRHAGGSHESAATCHAPPRYIPPTQKQQQSTSLVHLASSSSMIRRAVVRRGRKPLAFLALSLLLALLSLPRSRAWLTDPCQYHPHALHQLRLRFDGIVGQRYATETILAHVQAHLERYDSARLLRDSDPALASQALKPLVLSFHGPTGTGKSLSAHSLASALFFSARSGHAHTLHGEDFSDPSPAGVAASVAFLKKFAASGVRRCPLSMFIVEEAHMMAPGVLDGIRHLLDAQAHNARIHLPPANPPPGAEQEKGDKQAQAGGSKAAAESDSDVDVGSVVSANFGHAIWILTTNVGAAAVQKVAYDAAKEGRSRESLSPVLLSEMLRASMEHAPALAPLRERSLLSALVPFFPLFKQHVKSCAAVQLALRRKIWQHNGQLGELEWDDSVLSYTAGQLKYSGPISLYGCKNVGELLTQLMLSPLTRRMRRARDDREHALEQQRRDVRVPTRKKLWSWGSNVLARARELLTGDEGWNMRHTNASLAVMHEADGPMLRITLRESVPPEKEGQQATIHTQEVSQPLPSYADAYASTTGAAVSASASALTATASASLEQRVREHAERVREHGAVQPQEVSAQDMADVQPLAQHEDL